jgi:hypothetical protein
MRQVLRKLRAFIEHVKYQGADPPRDRQNERADGPQTPKSG